MRCLALTSQLTWCRRITSGGWPYCSVHRRQPFYVLLVILAGAIGSYLAAFLPAPGRPASPTEGSAAAGPLPDLVFVVGRPQEPVFWLFSGGAARADKPKYQFLLYDLDRPDTDQPRRILQIPAQLFDDYILPKHTLGPWKILDLSQRAKEVQSGHTVFGYVMVQCANCNAVRYYWVFLRISQAGWTLEVPEKESNMLNRMLAKIIYTGEQAASTVDSVVPLPGRRPIE